EPVVSSTTLRPGQTATLTAPFTMHEGMGGPHTFEITILSNDPQQPQKKVYVKADFGNWK
ncbi:MAG: hypothetical protein ONB05_04080, partial [candidate division KSB1 bacterium]|nr:hypothetical protein [candidate division KSB1 bacterium]